MNPREEQLRGIGDWGKGERGAFMNATLQAAYFTLAARALGLDVGPMGGFDKAQVDAAFFSDGRFDWIWLANLGYGDDAMLRPRNSRFAFAEIATFRMKPRRAKRPPR